MTPEEKKAYLKLSPGMTRRLIELEETQKQRPLKEFEQHTLERIQTALAALSTGQTTPPPQALEDWTLDQLRQANKVVKIFSRKLQGEIWLVAHPSQLNQVPEGVVGYTIDEMKDILQRGLDGVAIHKVKKAFQGEWVSVSVEKGLKMQKNRAMVA